MASRIYAIDLGAWSVKLAIASPGMRGATILQVVERELPPGDAPASERAAATLASMVSQYGLRSDTAYLGVFGDQVFTHVLEFGFTTLRRADLQRAIGAELEGVVPLDLEDMVYSFETLPPGVVPPDALADEVTQVGAAPLVPAPKRGRIAAATSGMRVLTYSMAKTTAQAMISTATDAGAEPRSLLPIGGAAVRLVERLPSLAAYRGAGEAIAVIDIGHDRTDVVVVRGGKAVFSRTVTRAGRNVTEAIARTWNISFAEAEVAKHKDGFVASTAEPAASDAWARIHAGVIGEIAPLARELRQTLSACRARTGDAPTVAILVGGGSRLRGLAPYLTEELAIPAAVMTADDMVGLVGSRNVALDNVDAAAMTVAMIHDAASGRPLFDLRQDDLAYKVDLSFLRQKAMPLAVAILAIVAFASVSAWASLYKLRHAEKILNTRLAAETTQQFGKAETVEQVLGQNVPVATAEGSPMPKMSAYDIMLAINENVPAKDKITLNITDLDIAANKIAIKGSAKTPEEIELLVDGLKKVSCFTDVSRGSTQTGANGEKQFQLTITATCM